MTGSGLITKGEEPPKYTGRFDRHVVETTWYGLCAYDSSTTNTYTGHIETLQVPNATRVCMNSFIAVNAVLSLDFPYTTPPGSTSALRTLKFDTPLLINVALVGTLTFSDMPDAPTNNFQNTMQLTVEGGPFDIRSTATCPKDTLTHGPPLVKYVDYPLTVVSSCHRPSLTFPEREGDDLIYEIVSFVDMLIYEPAYPPGSRVIFGGEIRIRSYYRVDTTQPNPADGPQLAVELTPGNLVLSWPASATGFVLESTDRLEPPFQWEAQPNVERVGDRYVYRVAPTGQGRFYRLRQQ